MSLVVIKERLLRENSKLREYFIEIIRLVNSMPNRINSSFYSLSFSKNEINDLLIEIRDIDKHMKEALLFFGKLDKKANENNEIYDIKDLLMKLKHENELSESSKEVLILYFKYEDLEVIKKFGLDENGKVRSKEEFYEKVRLKDNQMIPDEGIKG